MIGAGRNREALRNRGRDRKTTAGDSSDSARYWLSAQLELLLAEGTFERSLTASELRLARRAVARTNNRKIAQALFVTPKTVEMHLGNASRTLGIRSRHQLSAASKIGQMRRSIAALTGRAAC
ncbi:MAG: hypothetical protein JO153_12620 [Solirubrobacterales bacterium]|nr:hypothetical protein [Solirubrobacterales bacterium]